MATITRTPERAPQRTERSSVITTMPRHRKVRWAGFIAALAVALTGFAYNGVTSPASADSRPDIITAP